MSAREYGRGHVRLLPTFTVCPICQEAEVPDRYVMCSGCSAQHRVVMLTCSRCSDLVPTAELDAADVCAMCRVREYRSGEGSE